MGNYCFQSRSEALAVAKEKLRLFKSRKGWSTEVWENLGWHLSFRKGQLSLHYSPMDDTFAAYLSEDHYGGDSNFWHVPYSNKDPNKVVAHKIKVAKAFVNGCLKVIAEVER